MTDTATTTQAAADSTATNTPSPEPSAIEQATKLLNEMRAENEKTSKLISEQRKLATDLLLAGRSMSAPAPVPTKEELIKKDLNSVFPKALLPKSLQ